MPSFAATSFRREKVSTLKPRSLAPTTTAESFRLARSECGPSVVCLRCSMLAVCTHIFPSMGAKKEGDEGEEDDVGLDPSATWLPGRSLQPDEFSKERRLL